MIKYFSPLLPFIAAFAVFSCSAVFSEPGWINGAAQLVLFALVVCWPIWSTGRMSYVDIGWPLGLVLIGLVTVLLADGHWVRKALVCAAYVFAGLRMGLGALLLWKNGRLKVEFPRYEYQKRRWEKAGKDNTALAMQVEALVQGVANATFLALPAFIIAANPNPEISPFEIVGLVIWLGAFVMESIADRQKLAFLLRMKKEGKSRQVCNVGLWRYSRHPNYFAEWMVWNGLLFAAIPSWWALADTMHMTLWLLLGFGSLYASVLMYKTLVYYTGAVPSEFYSLQKRPDYERYQAETNRFFPGPVKANNKSI